MSGVLLGVGLTIGTSIFGSVSANKRARAARKAARKAADLLAQKEKNRQTIINPYANVDSVAGLAEDLSSQMSNTYDNLGVATSAAEIQAEQADISLANTLDTIRATGSSAGGATALAQAALQSKNNIAASIEQQEAANEQLRAQGEQNLQNKILGEKQRMQGIEMSEAQRLQNADVAGQQFEFSTRENRQIAELNRIAGQQQNFQQMEASARADQQAAIMGGVQGLSSLATSGAFKKKTPTATNSSSSGSYFAGIDIK